MSLPPRPEILEVNPDGISDELKALSQWVCWRLTAISDKWTKVPVQAVNPALKASSTDPSTWGTYEAAIESYNSGRPDGIGFVLTDDDPYTVVDMDACIADGDLSPAAEAAIQRLNSYTEISPSGTGVHIFVRAEKPGDKSGAKSLGYEFYSTGRYMTITGHSLIDRPMTVEGRQEELNALYLEVLGDERREHPGDRRHGNSPPHLTDDEVIEEARTAKNGDKFSRLWAGDTSAYDGDDSRADAAMAGILSFWSGDNGQIARIMRRSGLNRPKFDRPDYLERTINAARKGQSESYGGSGPRIVPPGGRDDVDTQPLEFIADEWSMPGSLESVSLPEFPAGVFPAKVEAFICGLAEATETPRALAASVALGGLSAAARNLYQILVRPGYAEQTNLWIVPFMPSGNRKSPVFAEVIAPLLDWEHKRAQQDRIDRAHWQAQRDMEEIELKDLKNSAAKGKEGRSSSDDRIKAIGLQEKLETEKKPKITKLIADDITPEKAVTVLDEQDGVLAVMSAEGASLLANAGGRYNNGIPNLDNLLKGHNGDTIIVDRGSREGEQIRRPYLTITVSPQPVVARAWGEMESFVQRGGAARILACFPASNVGYRTLINRPLPDQARADWGDLLTTILDLTPPQGGDADGHRIPCQLVLAPRALALWEAFAHDVEAMLRPGGDLESLEGWGSKAPGAAARIAGLLHIAAMAEIQRKPEDHEIDGDSMGPAIQIMRFFICHAKVFFDHLNGFGDQSAERALWDVIRTMNGPITKRALFRKARSNRFRRAADIEAPLSRLEELDYVRVTRQKHEGGKGGRPTDIIEINPYAQGQNRQYPESEAA
jgi:hypothetical protein